MVGKRLETAAGRSTAGVVASGFWFGPPDRPLAGRLHLPAGRRVHGGVVLCPGVGYEWALGHASLRALADALAAGGIAALRLDYDGVGESWGDDDDPGRVEAWGTSVVEAVGVLRGLGLADVSLVGLRIGALLAAGAADAVGATGVVLWDPPPSGREHTRRLRALATMQGWAALPDSLSVDGSTITDETVADLGALGVALGDRPSYVVLREDVPVPAWARGAAPGREVVHRPGQAEMFGSDVLHATVPQATVADIARWLQARHTGRPTDIDPADLATTAVAGGVRETVTTYDGMAAVVCEPADHVRSDRPTLVFLNTSVDPRVGPSRAWLRWSRRLAGEGFRSVRADLSGIGDSPARAGAAPLLPYGPHVVSDARRLAVAADEGAGVVLVGLCSGARNALDTALDTRPDAAPDTAPDTALDSPTDPAAGLRVRGLLLVNPVLGVTRDALTGLDAYDLDVTYEREPRRIVTRVPGPVWWLADRAGVLRGRIGDLRTVARGGADTLVVCSDGDYTLLRPDNARWALRDVVRSGRLTTRAIGGDHALFDPVARAAALDLLTAFVLERWSSGPTTVRPRPTAG